MTKLTGNTPFQMVNHATGKLSTKLQSLIEDHEESPLVSELAIEFVNWWNLPFDHPEKDAIGRGIWDRVDQIRAELDTPSDPTPMTKLEKVGSAVGNVIGRASGVTANATVLGAKSTSKWISGSAAPAVSAGSKELWKGLRSTVRATKESYKKSRGTHSNDANGSKVADNQPQQSVAQQSTDDDSPY